VADARLATRASERDALDAKAERRELFLAAISLWEAQMLQAKGRLQLPAPFDDWLTQAADPRVITVLPLDVEVVAALTRLPTTFHGDPADRLIVATARTHALPLATQDAAIRRSRLIKVWKA
jgi:PIN domain nuclease of toxin-antitoxin system